MKRIAYPAVVEKGEPGFGVYFPDLPGCGSGGATIAETVQNAHEALALHIAGMIQDGEALPSPTAIEAVVPEPPEITVAAIMLIGVSLPGRPQSIEISIDATLLDELDRKGMDRSRFLADAARAELARRAAG